MWVRALGIVLGVLLVVALGWSVAETHYRACVERAVATTGTSFASAGSENFFGQPTVADQIPTGTDPDKARRKAVAGCSRLPF